MNKYSHFQQPEATLDFHDLGVLDGATVKRMTSEFVADAQARGLCRVRLITGKGRHSKGDPLVKPQVQRTLEELRRAGVIESFADARIDQGGAGAVDAVVAPK